MASLTVTNTFSAGTIIAAAPFNTNYSDIVNYINNHNSGGTKWDALSTSGTLNVDGTSTLVGAVSITASTGTPLIVNLTELVVNSTSHFVSIKPTSSHTSLRLDSGSLINTGVSNKLSLMYQGVEKALFGFDNADLDLYIRNEASSGKTKFQTGGSNEYLTVQSTGAVYFPIKFDAKGTATNDSAATGDIGEYQILTASQQDAGSSGQFANMTQLTLGAGDWDVVGQIIAAKNTSNMANSGFIALSVDSGNTTTDHVVGDNQMTLPLPTSAEDSFSTVTHRFLLATSTVVYLKARASFSSGVPRIDATIRARRVR